MTSHQEDITTSSSNPPSSTYEQDQKTQAQIEAIEKGIKDNQSLTSHLQPISSLTKLYNNNDNNTNTKNFIKGCDYLSSKYHSWRMIRGDGNCYYRAFLYAVCEELLQGCSSCCDCANDNEKMSKQTKGDDPKNTVNYKSELHRLKSYIQKSIDIVTKYGYDKFTIETFHEELVELFDFLSEYTDKETTTSYAELEPKLHSKLNEENSTSDYCTWYLRVITSSYLKADADRFVHFLDDPNYFDVETFCSREVDPMGRECGMVQVLALAEAMSVRVRIEYLDGRDLNDDGALMVHQFGPDKAKTSALEISLLYRPGHYDILYSKK